MRRVLIGGCAAILCAALAVIALAEVDGDNDVAITAVVTNVTFTTARSSVLLMNKATSANRLYARLFWCGETAAAATTASPILLEPGSSVTYTHNKNTETGLGYCGFSAITAAGETASLRWEAK